jgi:hypothetical protein
LPAPSELHAEPPLGPLLLLEFAVAVAATALRARHIAIEGDFHPAETHEVSDSRGVFARLARERSQWPF